MSFKEFVHFILVIRFIGIKLFMTFPCFLISVLLPPFILDIGNLCQYPSWYCPISLALEVYQVDWSSQRTCFWFNLFFSIFFLFDWFLLWSSLFPFSLGFIYSYSRVFLLVGFFTFYWGKTYRAQIISVTLHKLSTLTYQHPDQESEKPSSSALPGTDPLLAQRSPLPWLPPA